MIDRHQFQSFIDEFVKVAVSSEWVKKMVQAGSESASPQRLSQFVSGMKDRALSVRQTRGTALPQLLQGMRLEGKADVAGDVGRKALAGMRERLAQTAMQARPAAVHVY